MSLAFKSYAAFPIPASMQPKIENQEHAAPVNFFTSYGNPHAEDKGVFGILSVIFAAVGLFPLAIAFGIVGMQNGRKFKALAQIGFILGMLEATILGGYLLYLFVLG